MVRRRGWGRGDYGDRFGGYGRFPEYVPVAKRRAEAAAYAKALEKKEGRKLAPVTVEKRAIATSFWGQAWCANLEAYSDFANRLPRGRTYVRNGSVIDLSITQGKITALVSGSEVYSVTISIATLPTSAWKEIQGDCARSIASLIDLLQGRFDHGVMQRLTRIDGGLFPKPKEIKMQCSCPDSAGVCKHIAAVMYGVGARLDVSPELLFTLRKVDHLELIGQAVTSENLDRALAGDTAEVLSAKNLGEMFGIELESSAAEAAPPRRRSKARGGSAPSSPAPKRGRRSGQTKDRGAEPRTRSAAAVNRQPRAATSSKSKQRVQVAGDATTKQNFPRLPASQTTARPLKTKYPSHV